MSAAAWAAGLFALLPGSAEATTAERVFAAVSPSVVVVEAGQQGSGVVVLPEIVATNCHVIGEATRITVRRGRIGHAASLVRRDLARDVCLLEVRTLEAPPVTMRPATDLRVGAAVYAVGAPQGLELSLSAGLVSQLRGAESGPLIQTTAPVSPGSSGGGLFDERGNLVGLTTFQHGQGQNLNFAVPVEWVAAAVNELFAWRRCRVVPEPRCVIEEALAAARDISDPWQRASALETIASALARAGDFPGAMAIAREIAEPRHRASAQASIAEALARAGDVAGAKAIAREIADPNIRSSALRSIAAAQAGARDIHVILVFTPQGEWRPAPLAFNPQTGRRIYYDYDRRIWRDVPRPLEETRGEGSPPWRLRERSPTQLLPRARSVIRCRGPGRYMTSPRRRLGPGMSPARSPLPARSLIPAVGPRR